MVIISTLKNIGKYYLRKVVITFRRYSVLYVFPHYTISTA